VNLGVSSYCAILKDDTSAVLTGFSGSYHPLITVREGEAFNLLYALKWAQESGS
jgi:hypothetical protein